MKVCHLTTMHIARDTRIFHKMCKSLAIAGYDVTLVAPGESFEEGGVKVVGIGNRLRTRVVRLIEMAGRVYKKGLALDADLYQLHDPELLLYALKLKRRGKKVIFDSHEEYVTIFSQKKFIPPFLQGLTKSLIFRYIRHVCRQLDAVLAVTPHIVEDYEKMGCRVEMITNYPIINAEAPFVPPAYDARRIGFAGGVSPHWHIHTVIQAMENVPGVTFALAGPMMSGAYQEMLAQLPAWPCVDYHGRITFQEAQDMLRTCSVGVAVFEYLSFSNGNLGTIGNTKIFEYMAAGLPVIGSNFPTWKTLLEDGGCGLCVPPGDQEAIEQALRTLLDNPQKARKMGEMGRHLVLEKYNWLQEEKKLLALYAQLVGSPAA